MWIRTLDGALYLKELHGVVFVTWVLELDREYAGVFPRENIQKFVDLIGSMCGLKLEAIPVQQY